jgi:DNA mismatch endonuclease, patch repair protein
MVDTVSKEKRSEIMSRVRGKDTTPEMAVRRLVFSLGYRYRLHDARLPGKPDLVFAGRRKVIFVHGCFWHRHDGCALARLPKSRIDFWARKLAGNKERDERNIAALRDLGWRVLVLWECELGNSSRLLKARITAFLGRSPSRNRAGPNRGKT